MESVIVVVDDESDILALVCAVLLAEGYAVLGLGDPGLLAGLPPDCQPRLVLLDLMLPDISGTEVARWLRGEGCPATPMVAMSASDQLLVTARESGLFDATMDKPFDLCALLQMIDRYVA